jgi:hypothetical protein
MRVNHFTTLQTGLPAAADANGAARPIEDSKGKYSRAHRCASTGFSHAAVTHVTAHSSLFWKPDEVQGGTEYRLTPVSEVAGRIEDD